MKKSLAFFNAFDIISCASEKDAIYADLCNGSTADSDSVSRGSNPLSVGKATQSLTLLEPDQEDLS